METIFLVLGMEGSPLSLNNHEVLRDEPEGAWAARPLELIREGGRTVLDGFAITDPSGREREVNTCSPCLAQRKHSLKASLQLVLFMPRRLPRGEL